MTRIMEVKWKNERKEPVKNVYSLMLEDDVVAAIDRLAYLQNTNRSGLVNRILAEYASVVTPEQRIREAFGRITALLDGQDSFRLAVAPSDTMLSLSSALLYKYNPTVKYSVELYRTADHGVGELRVSMRTQNRTLVAYMMRFYELWSQIERSYLGEVLIRAEDGKYARRLRLREGTGPSDLGERIATYIRTFDAALKAYFTSLDDVRTAAREMERIFRTYLQNGGTIL